MAACTTFFLIPELVASLSSLLSTQDLARLVKTNRLLFQACSPLFWTHLNIHHSDATLSLFHSPTSLQVFTESLHSIRSLKTESNFISHYVIGLASFLENNPTSPFLKPRWLPSLTACCTTDLSFPPLTNLTHLSCSLSLNNLPCGLSWTANQLSLQLCWFVSLNSGLQDLSIEGLRLSDDLVLRVVARTISRLHRLKNLTLAPARKAHVSHDVAEILLFNCPPSIESFTLDSEIVSGPMVPNLMPNDKDQDEGPVVVKKTTLFNLKELNLPENYAGYHTNQLCSIMEHCPALKSWLVPSVAHEDEGQELTDVLKKHCPKIQELFIRAPGKEQHGPTVIRIMEKLPCQQLEVLYFKGYREFFSDRMTRALQRHSDRLREIRFDRCCRIEQGTIMALLTKCKALEVLVIEGFANIPSKVYLSLEEAVEHPWASSRLRHLQLVMIFGEFLDGAMDPEGVFSWTKGDLYRWSLIEKLALQIGSLKDLEVLDIRALNGTSGSAGAKYQHVPVPGLLMLEDKTKNRFGYLDRLQGLCKLRELGGSFRISAMTEATGVIGEKEAAWLSESKTHLPALKAIELMPFGYELNKVPECLKKLQDERPDLAIWLR
ncbi:hypothetical protein FBU30_004466 [Linnemannia zychae]|nr:hypothetical protein FBU30_004466 [Linnemannia zychae]